MNVCTYACSISGVGVNTKPKSMLFWSRGFEGMMGAREGERESLGKSTLHLDLLEMQPCWSDVVTIAKHHFSEAHPCSEPVSTRTSSNATILFPLDLQC